MGSVSVVGFRKLNLNIQLLKFGSLDYFNKELSAQCSM